MLCRAPTGQVLGPKHPRGSWLPAFMVTFGPGAQDTGCPHVAEATHDSQEAVQTAFMDQIVSPDSHIAVTTPRASEHDCLETGS